MTLILDSGGLSALAGDRARLAALLRADQWPAELPSIVLTESLTGDHRRDIHTNQVIRACLVRDVDEQCAREAARLRTATGRAGTISAVDALVVAYASGRPTPAILTSDPGDIEALAQFATRPIAIWTA